jgi:hypothetical protein
MRIALSLVTALLLACSAPAVKVPPSKPLSATIKLDGTWDSNYGQLKLITQDSNLNATYEFGQYDYERGIISGKIKGDIVIFDWVQPGDRSAAVPRQSGKGWWRISQDGLNFEGEWGFEKSNHGGGKWSASRAQRFDTKEN